MMEYILIGVGLVSGILLFWRFPYLTGSELSLMQNEESTQQISVVIPVRNEEVNLPILLSTLKDQSYQNFEVICVDDGSSDRSWSIIRGSGHKGIQIEEKPAVWMGKSYACHVGSMEAKGELLLFLDADVRLGKDALWQLVHAYQEKGHTISVQPHHFMEEPYEQLSFIFNMVQYAGNGVGLPYHQLHAGLFGPVILMEKTIYKQLGGHESIKTSVVDDIDLGIALKRNGSSFFLLMGQPVNFSYRMYSEGFADLYRGWVKNQAVGASKAPLVIFVLIFLWLSSLGTVVTGLMDGFIHQNLIKIAVHVCLYVVWVLLLLRWGRKIGNFKRKTIFCYPFYLLFFFIVFFDSVFRRIFGLGIKWKGRNIITGGK